MCCCSNKSRPDSWYSRIFARMYNPIVGGIEKRVLGPRRAQLLSSLKGHVLEIGAGTGVNFEFYHPEANVLACEPSEAMLQYAQKQVDELQAKHIELICAGVGDELLLEKRPAGGFDTIVCTLVLCTIPDAEAALVDMLQFLKPDGQLIVLEHIRAKSPLAKATQWLCNPLWKALAEGCHLIRPTDQLLSQTGYRVLEQEYFTAFLPFYQARLLPPKRKE